jgi:hypothetical protein
MQEAILDYSEASLVWLYTKYKRKNENPTLAFTYDILNLFNFLYLREDAQNA